jgi:hypothetical protein
VTTLDERRDAYVAANRAEAAELTERGRLWNALRVAVWVGIWTFLVPLIIVGAGVAAVAGRILARGLS